MSRTTVQKLLRQAARMLERCPPESTTLLRRYGPARPSQGLRQAAGAIEAQRIDLDSGMRVANRHLGHLVRYIADILEITGVEAEDWVDLPQACPDCGERDMARLVWNEDADELTCQSCGRTYRPGK